MIISVNLLYLLCAPVVTMVTNASSPAPVTHCMGTSAVTSVCVVSMVTVHHLMDHVTAIEDILEQPVTKASDYS